MAKWREIEGSRIEGSEENGYYWKPVEEGDEIEGTIIDFVDGDYGPQLFIQTEEKKEVTLPAHADLQKKIDDLYEDDYIRVTLSKIKKSNNPEYNDKPFYRVEVRED